jgi:DNA invertase Pin-like site-specific DNA recombinase
MLTQPTITETTRIAAAEQPAAPAVPQKIITEIPAAASQTDRVIHKQNLRVAAYCRVSTDSEEQLSSYKSQIDYYTGVIDENPYWKTAGIFADEGLSGVSTKKRREFNRMIQKCRAGRIDLIITKSVSRFARNTLDSISWARRLKKMGVGIIFEKEGVNTLEMNDEILLTIFASLAQAESESLSKNVAMGFRQSFKAGKVPFRYKGFLGYRKGADGNPEIVPEEAAVVKRVFHRYLAGDSVARIAGDLEADGVPAASGGIKWSPGAIRYMLRNERYIGDALLQKTYVADMLTKQSKKNTGELPQYYISNNHPAIIDRDIFQKVQEEIARRGCKRKTPSKTARTEQSKYSGKYALNEILVCGECGTPYRRVTWSLHGVKRIVWRCISRLEHGKKFCKQSPTLHEAPLHTAIMDAISGAADRGTLQTALLAGIGTAYAMDKDTLIYRMAKTRVDELKAQFDALLETVGAAGFDEDYYGQRFKKISDEMAVKRAVIEEYEAKQTGKGHAAEIAAASELLEGEPLTLDEYDDHIVRQLIDTIRVTPGGALQITFKGGDTAETEVTAP